MFISEEPIHINADKGSIASVVLMPGDPLRAKYIAERFLEDVKEVCNRRNILGYTGKYKGKLVSVVASGMGMPSIGIYSWELFHYYDVKAIIRIGTCGAVSEDVNVPELILASSAHSESNFAYTFDNFDGNVTYPSEELNKQIENSAKALGYKLHIGAITTMDVFGPYIDYDRVLSRIPQKLNVIAEEMEGFALFHVANHFKKEAACILTTVDSKFSNIVLSGEDREKSLNEMITLALETAIKKC